MNTTTKILGLAAGAGLLLYLGKKAKDTVSNFTFELQGFGNPTINGSMITVPIMILCKNPTPLPINIDRLVADVFVDKGGKWVKAAQVNQPMSVPSGETVQKVFPKFDIKSILGGNLLDTFSAIITTSQSRRLNIRVDVTGNYGAIPLPMQTFTKEITF